MLILYVFKSEQMCSNISWQEHFLEDSFPIRKEMILWLREAEGSGTEYCGESE